MRIVIKIGTSTLAHPTGLINIRRVEGLCKVISDLKNAGHDIIIVSSGAIGMGVGKLSLGARPEDMPTKQAAAAVGQCELMYTYDRAFNTHGHIVAQILVTADAIRHPKKAENFKNTLLRLLELGVIPVINENDTIATKEITIGDNDTLSAMVAVKAGAALLIILSDIDGLYTADPKKDPKARLIHDVPKITKEIDSMGGGVGSGLGTGGMKTKMHAAQIATQEGIDMVIANGKNPEVLYGIVAGEKIGTRFHGGREKLTGGQKA